MDQVVNSLVQFERIAAVGCWFCDSGNSQLELTDYAAGLLNITSPCSCSDFCALFERPAEFSDDNWLMESMHSAAYGKHILRLRDGMRWFLLTGEYTASKLGYQGTLREITEEKQLELALRQSEHRWRTLTENTPDVIIQIDLESRIQFINYTLPEFTTEQVLNMSFYEFLPADRHAEVRRCLENVKRTGRPDKYTVKFPDPEGNVRHYESFVNALFLEGRLDSLIVSSRDVTDRVEADIQRRMLSEALENTTDSVVITDPQGRIIYINQSYLRLNQLSSAELLGSWLQDLLTVKQNRAFRQNFIQNLQIGQVFSSQLSYQMPDKLMHQQVTVTPLRNSLDEIIQFLITGKDISELVQVKDRLHYLAEHDVLTGLSNRARFNTKLLEAIAKAQFCADKLAVLFVDMDSFKLVNDTLGHVQGDLLLQIVAKRLQHCLRARDVVARLGGDEFAILLESVHAIQEVNRVARNVLNIFDHPVELEAQSVYITASIGVALAPDNGHTPEELLKAADMAMYKAKHLGKNSYQFYSDELALRAEQALHLGGELRDAIERQQFHLYFQPQYDFVNNKLIGMEALLRWQHPQRGLIPPSEFVHLLEEQQLISMLGEQILLQACDQLSRWKQAGFEQLLLSVNVSSYQLFNRDVFDTLLKYLQQLEINPARLEIEITESAILHSSETVRRILQYLQSNGISIALDDFGTGYSSLSYLQGFPINTLKIDSSFVALLPENHNTVTLVRAIIALAGAMELRVIAEGVENHDQLEFLQQNGCSLAQGYLFQQPLAEEKVLPFLQTARTTEWL